MEVPRKIWVLGGGGGQEKPIYRGGCLKIAGCLGQFADLRGAWQERGVWCFWGVGGWYPNAHYIECRFTLKLVRNMIITYSSLPV